MAEAASPHLGVSLISRQEGTLCQRTELHAAPVCSLGLSGEMVKGEHLP